MRNRLLSLALALLCFHAVLAGSTLEKLSLEEMISASTMVVRARVGNAHSHARGSILYTEYDVQVTEVLSGSSDAAVLRVALPGGEVAGRRQVFSGVPTLARGAEYILFLWRGRNGLLQLVGLSQGLLEVRGRAAQATAARGPIEGMLLSRKSGLPVRDEGLRISLEQLREAVRTAGGSQGGLR